MGGQCAGIKRDGGRCTVILTGSQEYCYQHDPARAEDRRRAASRAGRSKPSRELNDVKDRIREMIADVRDDKMDRADAAVCGQLYNSLIRCISVELKLKEQEELIERLEQVEAELESRKRSRPWG
jgi:hypothetical protein